MKPITKETATASRPFNITDGGIPSKIMKEMLLVVVNREGIPVLTVDWICSFTMQCCIRLVVVLSARRGHRRMILVKAGLYTSPGRLCQKAVGSCWSEVSINNHSLLPRCLVSSDTENMTDVIFVISRNDK